MEDIRPIALIAFKSYYTTSENGSYSVYSKSIYGRLAILRNENAKYELYDTSGMGEIAISQDEARGAEEEETRKAANHAMRNSAMAKSKRTDGRRRKP